MALSEAARKDLHKLALERVDDAVSSVAQLLDDNEQIFHLMVHVLVSAFNASVAFAHAHHRIDGKEVPLDICRAKVLTVMAESIGLETKLLTDDEAKEHGFKKQ
jgi:hypothetical protein